MLHLPFPKLADLVPFQEGTGFLAEVFPMLLGAILPSLSTYTNQLYPLLRAFGFLEQLEF